MVSGCDGTRSLILGLFSVLLLPPVCNGNAWDIEMTPFKDSECLEVWGDPRGKYPSQMMMIEGVCYTNIWSNSSTWAAMMPFIISYGTKPMLKIWEYEKHCNEFYDPINSKIKNPEREAGRCETLCTGVWVKYVLRFRSNDCVGLDCSRISVARMNYFTSKDCSGMAMEGFSEHYPITGECLAWGGTNITDFGKKRYVVDDQLENITYYRYWKCSSCACKQPVTIKFQTEKCYRLFEYTSPRSFMWNIDKYGRLTRTVGLATLKHGCSRWVVAFALGFVAFVVFDA